MSRIGKLPIQIPGGVQVDISDNNTVKVKGPKGELFQQVDRDITVSLEDGELVVKRPSEQKRHKALHGLYRSLIQNMITGVTEGFKIEQELVGVGYRAPTHGHVLDLVLGFYHHFVFQLPPEVKVIAEIEIEITTCRERELQKVQIKVVA